MDNDDHNESNRFIPRPLIWLPSKSWSVINKILPYLRFVFISSEVYVLFDSNPRIFFISIISLLSITFLFVSPLTFNNLPFIGYTPIIFLSVDDSPDTIPAFAESPSQNIIVHIFDFSVPAQFASISLGIPLIFLDFVPSFFFACLFSLISLKAHALSTIPSFANFSINLLLTLHEEPNLLTGVFI